MDSFIIFKIATEDRLTISLATHLGWDLLQTVGPPEAAIGPSSVALASMRGVGEGGGGEGEGARPDADPSSDPAPTRVFAPLGAASYCVLLSTLTFHVQILLQPRIFHFVQ